MESALYGIYALVVFVSEILLVRCAHSFDFWYVNNSCVNTVRQHFPWSILYLFSYLKLYLIKITSAQKFCGLNKAWFFYQFLKSTFLWYTPDAGHAN